MASYARSPYDVHEMLKARAFAPAPESGPGGRHFEASRPDPARAWGVSDQYLVLDSISKAETSRTGEGEFAFNFMLQGVTSERDIGVSDQLDTVIDAEIGTFLIPALPLVPYELAPVGAPPLVANAGVPATPAGGSTELDNPLTQLPGRRLVLELDQVGRQAVPDVAGSRHHFEFRVTPTPVGDRWELEPAAHGGRFVFTDPIQAIHGLTLRFRSPYRALRFPLDVLYGVTAVSDAAQLLEFRFVAADATLNTLAVNDRIFFAGFASGIGDLDRWVNRVEGHVVGAAGFVANTSFRLNPDVDVSGWFLANTPIPSTTRVRVIVAKNRLRIPIRFRRVVPRTTNYITPQ